MWTFTLFTSSIVLFFLSGIFVGKAGKDDFVDSVWIVVCAVIGLALLFWACSRLENRKIGRVAELIDVLTENAIYRIVRQGYSQSFGGGRFYFVVLETAPTAWYFVTIPEPLSCPEGSFVRYNGRGEFAVCPTEPSEPPKEKEEPST